ncbi:MAG: hypothetical protein ACETVZ_00425 [Phycisphaerae bacterium]
MAFVYNQERILTCIFRWDESMGIYSSNLAGLSVFDYFDDACTVDDAIYFMWTGYAQFLEIVFNVGTAFAAASHTIVWEYYGYDAGDGGWGWHALPNVVDNTNGFTVLGINSVTWDKPPRFYDATTVNGIFAFWIRCRLSAVNTPTEGGANQTNTVKVKDDAIEFTGYTEGAPCTLEDIYNADVAGGWGRVTKQGNQYRIDCRLWVGDGSIITWLSSKNEQVEFTRNLFKTFCLQNNANFKMGDLDVNGIPYKGSNFLMTNYQSSSTFFTESSSKFKFYDSEIRCRGDKGQNDPVNLRGVYPDFVIKRSKVDFEKTQRFIIYGDAIVDGLELYNNTFITNQSPTEEWVGIKFIGPTLNAFHPHFGTPVILRNATIGDDIVRVLQNYHAQCQLINPILDWTKLTLQAVHADGWWKVIFGLDVHVSDYENGNDIPGATVILYDKDGTEIFSTTTDANGNIVTQEIVYRYIYGPASSMVTYSPHKLIVKKAGYQVEQDIFDMNEKKVLQVSLQKAIAVFFDMGRPVVNLKKSDPKNKKVMVL